MKNLLIVDGNSILNRAFYGIRPLSAPDGTPTNAVYGFINILKKHTDNISPALSVCAFDMKAPTFRHLSSAEYKANRKPMPEELAAQLPIAKEAAEAMGFHVVECEGFEADDIIGTVCRMGDEAEDIHSFALTGDRDSLQLLSERTSVILVKTKEDIIYTPESFKEEYSVTPTEYIDVKALMGDSSDNIPGVRGIGEKSAFKLICEYHSLDNLYDNIDSADIGKSAKEKLTAGREDAYKSKYLATIVKNAPVGELSDFLTGGLQKTKLRELFSRLNFTALAKRFDLSEEKNTKVLNTPEAKKVTPGELDSLSISDPAVLLSDGDLYISDGESVYLCKGATGEELSRFFGKNEIVCHDFKKLCRSLAEHGIKPRCSFDTMLAAYLIGPGEGNYPEERLAAEYIGELGDTPASLVFAVSRLVPILREKLMEYGMYELLCKTEIPLAGVLADMEKVGMKVDCEGLASYSSELKEARDALAEAIYSDAGHAFNLNSPKQLAQVLFEELHLPVQKKTKSGASTNVEVLSALLPYHPIAGNILKYREISKLISTYCDVLPTLADESGRVHTTFNQTGTATGRLSSNDPNLQNIPVRGELGREIRKYFTADEGCVLIDADYSQIELRVLAEISGDENMQNAFLSGEDIHTATAARVFGVSPLMVDSELRRRAKAVNFGIVYGIGAFSLAKDLGITRRQASDYIESYLATYPSVDAYLKRTVTEASECGYTVTAYGRRRPIPELSSSNKNVRAFGERVAMNSPIQGTAADIIKTAMINTTAALEKSGLSARLVMQVHDELIIEAAEKDAAKAAEILKKEMESVAETRVPLSAEVSQGASWYEAK